MTELQSSNRALLQELHTSSRDAFIHAYQTRLGEKLPDAYKDKALSSLCFTALKQSLSKDAVVPRIDISPLTPSVAESLVDPSARPALLFDATDDEKRTYIDASAQIQEVRLDEGLDIVTAIPEHGIELAYTPNPQHPGQNVVTTEIMQVETDDIKAAIVLANDAANIAHSNRPDFTNSAEDRLLSAIFDEPIAGFRFHYDLDLDINGHESPAFLTAYRDHLERSRIKQLQQISRHQHVAGPMTSFAEQKEHLQKIKDAIARVKAVTE